MIDEEELKKWIEENYLQLTGGTLTNHLNISYPDISADSIPYMAGKSIYFVDKEGKKFSQLQSLLNENGTSQCALVTYNTLDQSQNAYLTVNMDADGSNPQIFTNVTPPTDAPGGVIYNKTALNRDFLPKSGNFVVNDSFAIDLGIDATDPSANSTYKDITFCGTGGNTGSKRFGFIRAYHHKDNHRYLTMYMIDENNTLSSGGGISIVHDYNLKRSYTTLPAPRGEYNADGVTYQSMVDRCVGRITGGGLSLYIDAVNGSDTADIENGRGLSGDKPFKTLAAAWAWVRDAYANTTYISIRLLSDITITSEIIISNHAAMLSGINGTKKITFTGADARIIVRDNAYLQINEGIQLEGNSNNNFMQCRFNSYVLFYAPIAFSGNISDCAFYSNNNSVIDFDQRCTVSGSFTGKRYIVSKKSAIFTYNRGVNFIPGTEAGTCDESSTYI